MAGRDTVIAAGLRAFSRLGYQNASIREIARESGNSVSVLYHYFRSKDELFGEIIRVSADEYFEMCETRLSEAGTGASERLKALVDVTVEHRIERRAEANLLASEIHVLPEDLQKSVRSGWRRASRIWDDVINEGIASGEFVCAYPIEARRGIVAMCNSVRDWFEPEGLVSQEETSHRLFELSRAMLGHASVDGPR